MAYVLSNEKTTVRKGSLVGESVKKNRFENPSDFLTIGRGAQTKYKEKISLGKQARPMKSSL